MNEQTLARCLQLGYSERFNDRNGIGRFGVGFTLGSLHQCKDIEVYSKQAGGDWMQAVDLMWDGETSGLFSAVLAFWFGNIAISKYAGK